MSIVLNNPVTPDISILNKYLERIHKSGHYTNFGPLHKELTQRLEEYLGVENMLLVANGTFALQIAYKVLGVNKAITTPFSFVATSSSLLWQGIDIQFCDIDKYSCNLSPSKVNEALLKDSLINGVVATHVYGNPCDVKQLSEIAKKHNVKLIYDAAHAFGVNVEGKSVLHYGDASILSFHATKVFHTVEGGAIIFKRKEDYEKAKQLINFSLKNSVITDVGINAKLNEYQCAVGLTLLDRVDYILEHRISLFEYYKKSLSSVVEMPKWYPDSSYNGSYLPIILRDESERQKISEYLKSFDIQSRKYFYPSLNTLFRPEQTMPISENISSRILCLPLHFNMTKKDVKSICQAVISGVLN